LGNKINSMIVGTGSAVPKKVLTNQDLEKIVDTSDEWIQARTGMQVRHIAEEGVNTSDLCSEAALKATAEAGVHPEEIDAIIIGTVTGDIQFPSTACYVQEKIGAINAAAFDIAAACSGFIYGLTIADSFLATGQCQTVVVIGGEILSRITDYEDRATCVLFGDGAAGVVLKPSDGQRGILGSYIKSDGRLAQLLYMPGGGTKYPASRKTIDEKLHYLKMEGREVFKAAVTAMGDAAIHILKTTGLRGEDIDLLISHQANIRIIKATARRAGLPMDKVFINVHKYGNTSAASIPIALDEARKSGRLKEGDRCLMVAFGGGFTWGSTIVQF
jgi:3-oxoacyl-[acyl-carrier-protein] synthase-3